MRIGIVGTGWRARFFVEIAAQVPEITLTGVVYRKTRPDDWGVPLFASGEALLDAGVDFVVLCPASSEMEAQIRWYVGRGVPVLAETFPVDGVETLRRLHGEFGGANVQVAEQYPFQPLNMARIAVARSGVLGRVYQVETSIPNTYHGTAVQRRVLGVGRKRAVVRAQRYGGRIVNGPTRAGDPTEERLIDVNTTLFQLDWGDARAFSEFEEWEHRSFIRTPSWCIRGERGELRGEDVVYLAGLCEPCRFTLERVMAGAGPNVEGLFLRGVRGGQAGWLYQNPFMGARLMDDEIAAAQVLRAMAAGQRFYPLEEALIDMHFTLLVEEAAKTGRTIEMTAEPWTE